MQKKVLIHKALLTFALLSAHVATHAMDVETEVDATALLRESLTNLFPTLHEKEDLLNQVVTTIESNKTYSEKSSEDDSYVLIGKLLISDHKDTQLLGMHLANKFGNTLLKKLKAHQEANKTAQEDETSTASKSVKKSPAQLLTELSAAVNDNSQLLQADQNDSSLCLIGKLVSAKEQPTQKLGINLLGEFKNYLKKNQQTARRSRASSSASKVHENGKVESTSSAEDSTKKDETKLEDPNKTNQKSGFGLGSFFVVGAVVVIAGYFINEHLKNQQDK